MSLHLEPVIRLPQTCVAKGAFVAGERVLPEETPVALTYNGSTHAVMMASPADLEDFAFGFSLSEGIIAEPGDLVSIEIIEHDLGYELRMWLRETCRGAYQSRRRAMAGPVGCGLCGVESLTEAVQPASNVDGTLHLPPRAISAAMADLSEHSGSTKKRKPSMLQLSGGLSRG